jgi:hypothetical protein
MQIPPHRPQFRGYHIVNVNCLAPSKQEAYDQWLRENGKAGMIQEYRQFDEFDVLWTAPQAREQDQKLEQLVADAAAEVPGLQKEQVYWGSPAQQIAFKLFNQQLEGLYAVRRRVSNAVRSFIENRARAQRAFYNRIQDLIERNPKELVPLFKSDPNKMADAILTVLNNRHQMARLFAHPDRLNRLWRVMKQDMPVVAFRALLENPWFQFPGEPSCYIGAPDSPDFKMRAMKGFQQPDAYFDLLQFKYVPVPPPEREH